MMLYLWHILSRDCKSSEMQYIFCGRSGLTVAANTKDTVVSTVKSENESLHYEDMAIKVVHSFKYLKTSLLELRFEDKVA